MGRLGASLWRVSIRRGPLGGNRGWMGVFAALATLRVLRRLAGRVPSTVYQQELAPGESLIITHLAETRG